MQSIQTYINQASFVELDKIRQSMFQRLDELEIAQFEIKELCRSHGWRLNWYIHSDILGTVFLCIQYNKHYQEFLGYNTDLRVARNIAATKALRFFQSQSQTEYHHMEVKCLDLQAESFQHGIKTYHQAVDDGMSIQKAEDKAYKAEQQFLGENLNQFLLLTNID